MKSILQTCTPRPDIIEGTFNPEIFTASLSQVLQAYEDSQSIKTVYTDPEIFFKEATYPTGGLKTVLASTVGRLSGINTYPAIQRLETAFGGGKTHTLIALTHLAKKGNELASLVQDYISEDLLPESGTVHVVGIAGDELPLYKTKGSELVPYTLWGEIAYRIGGDSLYNEVRSEAESYAAPGNTYFQKVFSGRKILIMLDELAQYATRLQAARPDGSDQLAAFLMALHGYARNHSHISIVLTLAGSADAFSRQSSKLSKLVSEVKGDEVDQDEAMSLAQQAEQGLRSVVSRDASTVVPVQGGEISRILAKRLFEYIEDQGAEDTVSAYLDMYRRHASYLPAQASQEDFKSILKAHYPFHPTFIRYLNGKLATLETFQGTRGVLRMLAFVLRSIWSKRLEAPMIHTCHIDLTNPDMVNEILGRTGGSDLQQVLNTDIGGPDTGNLSLGKSYAQFVDQKNPHPQGYPLYEYTWRTIFLHSLVGRSEGLSSNIFGLSEQDALFDVSNPAMTPPQVQMALEEIDNSAQYLRKKQGRYFASLEPSVNRALTTIETGLRSRSDYVMERIRSTCQNVVKSNNELFNVLHEVTHPEDIPDKGEKPILALVSLDAEEVNIEQLVTMAGPNRAREKQNLCFILVPRTVLTNNEHHLTQRKSEAQEIFSRIEGLARRVVAMKRLQDRPEDYGITAAMLIEQDFAKRFKERAQALETTIAQCFDSLWYPSASGRLAHKEIRTGGGEGGAAIIEEIKKVLRQDGELITENIAETQETLQSLAKLFFYQNPTPSLQELRNSFTQVRDWPVLEQPELFETIVRYGVERGVWCLFRMPSSSDEPEEFYSRDTGALPLNLDLTKSDWSLVSMKRAQKLGWGPKTLDKEKVKGIITYAVQENEASSVHHVQAKVNQEYGEVPENEVKEAISSLVKSGQIGVYSGNPDQMDKPSDLVYGRVAVVQPVKQDQTLIAPSAIAKRGWKEEKKGIKLSGEQAINKIWPILKQMGQIYAQGGESNIDLLEMFELEIPGGGKLRISMEDVSPEGVKHLDEFFETLVDLVQKGENTDMELEIKEPDDECSFVNKIK